MVQHTFISYSRQDEEFALKLARDLRQGGANIWMDQFDIEAGEDWDIAVEKALYTCGSFLLILSPASVESKDVRDELNVALTQKKRIIPVLHEACERPLRIHRMNYIDFTGEYRHGLARLLKALKVSPTPSQAVKKSRPEPQVEQPKAAAEEQRKEQEELTRRAEEEKRRQEQTELARQAAGEKLRKEQETVPQQKTKQPEAIPRKAPVEKSRGPKKIFLGIALVTIIIITSVFIIKNISSNSGPQHNIPVKDSSQTTAASLNGLFSLDNFAEIPAGSFQMGSENGYDDEKPLHTVRITKSFYLGKHEVTREQWESVMGNNPSYFKGKNLPVEQVSWNDVRKFLDRLNQQTGREIFRLPTEAEWEYACRAGTTADYAGNLDDMAWYDSNSGGKTHPVGTKQPNEWGLYDMHGNVYEWCADWYGETYYDECKKKGIVEDPAGPESGSFRVLRGGAWYSNAQGCRSADRYNDSPGPRNDYIGFRLVFQERVVGTERTGRKGRSAG
jgi:formylglycine-generating enzyme required for sulfatase activity